jgi:flagellum-specific peptidoglycan hydrolase FlgJ
MVDSLYFCLEVPMLSAAQTQALAGFYKAAKESNHIFPAAAACEGCVETAWGTSKLYLQALNVFGLKQGQTPRFSTVSFPTKEYLNRVWVVVQANFIKYPTLADAFRDRMQTLQRLAPSYPHYASALAATTPEQYLTEVSKTWSTDPLRAQSCIQILRNHQDVLNG